jgi:hypothetical protein
VCGLGKKNKSWHAWNDGQGQCGVWKEKQKLAWTKDSVRFGKKTKVGIEPKPNALDVNENITRTTTLVRGVEK